MSEPAPTTTLIEALARAQGQMSNAKFDRKNPHFKSEYASLPAILDVARKPLADNGIAVTQSTHMRDGMFCLVTTLRGYGEELESVYPLPLPSNMKPQEFGSVLTYARRYSLSAMLNISADEDDDANVAQAAGNGKAAAEEIISPAQLETLQLELADLITKDPNFLPDVLKGCEISALKYMPVEFYDYTLNKIKARKKYLAKQEAVS